MELVNFETRATRDMGMLRHVIIYMLFCCVNCVRCLSCIDVDFIESDCCETGTLECNAAVVVDL